MTPDDDDPIADAILSGSTFERLRATRFSPWRWPIATKIAYQSYLLVALAGVVPLTLALPPEVAETYLGASRLDAAPNVLVVGVFSLVVIVLTAVAHAVIGLYRLHLEPDIPHETALELLAWEDVASSLGLGTAGFGVLITLAGFGVGYAGAGPDLFLVVEQSVASLLGPGGVVSVFWFGFLALASASTLYWLSGYLHMSTVECEAAIAGTV